MTELIVNFDEPREAATAVQAVRSLRGWHRLTIAAYRKRRSDAQNRYYWPCYVAPFADFLRAQGETITDEQAHEIMKHKFLRVSRYEPGNDEWLTWTRSTTELSTVEFNTYLDLIATWLAEMFGIVVSDPTNLRTAGNAARRIPETDAPTPCNAVVSSGGENFNGKGR